MNLSSSEWSHNQSEVTADTAMVGDVISYSDVCNCMLFNVIALDSDSLTLQNVDDPEYVYVKTYDQFTKRWEYHGEETHTRHLNRSIPKK